MKRRHIILLLGFLSFNLGAQVDFDTIVDYDGFFDELVMDEVLVTGAYAGQLRNRSNLSVSTLDYNNPKYSNKTLSQLLENIPGIFVDGSIGEVQNRVHSRGISIAAEDDLGWYYMSLMEDGLPVTMTQHTFYSPDLFFRADGTIDKVEFIRGGLSSLLGVNAPGGIFNAISKDGTDQAHAAWKVGYGQGGQSRDQINIDLQLDGPLKIDKSLYYNVGMHYRFDEGPRNANLTFNQGAQFKANLKKISNKTIYKLRLKYLNDNTNRYLGLPATNWNDPQVASGFDFNNTALMLPSFSTVIPDGRGNPALDRISFDTEQGIHVTDGALQLDIDHQLGPKSILRVKSKYSRKQSNWNTFIGNQPLGLESFLPYFLTGNENPWGQIDFNYVGPGTPAASIDNTGALKAFQGMQPTFEYLNADQLPNDALLGTALWYKDDRASEWMNRITLEGSTDNHKWNISSFIGLSKVDMYTTASYAFATYEAQPRLLSATLVDPINGNVELSDPVGVSNYNGLFYEDGTSNNTIASLAVQDIWKIHQNWSLHLGAKVENVAYKGSRYLPSSTPSNGGLDGDSDTGYDNASLQRGQEEKFDDGTNTFSYSIGVNHTLTSRASLFANYSLGNKAPELNYYFNTFSGVPIAPDPEVQRIDQFELGFNNSGKRISTALVGFYSQLDNFSSNDFAFDDMSGTIFYTPFQNNKVSVLGLEGEAVFSISQKFSLSTSFTIQSSKTDRFSVYDANDSIDTSDDTVSDFSGNKVPHTPGLTLSIRPEFKTGNITAYATYRYMSARYANAENSFELPGYGTVGAGIQYNRGRFVLSLDSTNLLNGEGLVNFFGPDSFGSSANQASAEYIKANPNGRFVVFPILPRVLRLSLGYHF